jgi:hypothetical protein
MLRERLNQLFTLYDQTIQTLISEVLTLEQAYISMDKPHLKEPLDQIISRLANREMDQVDGRKD